MCKVQEIRRTICIRITAVYEPYAGHRRMGHIAAKEAPGVRRLFQRLKATALGPIDTIVKLLKGCL
ncbi:MAG TPA: hypothetical protein VLH60_02130, partial [Sedimentisphaerales bacterium]|nr:hypothetical protein [Sedimentisphaerales bacterium]